MSGVVGSSTVTQVGFIVRDIYETKKKWAQFLGVEDHRQWRRGTMR